MDKDKNEKIFVKPFDELKSRCLLCGSTLKISFGQKQIRIDVKIAYRRLFICESCGSLYTLTIAPISIETAEWKEDIRPIFDYEYSKTKPAISFEEGAISFVKQIFRCEKKGFSCDMYKYASSNIGPIEFCPNRRCPYDPYTEVYKRKHWYSFFNK